MAWPFLPYSPAPDVVLVDVGAADDLPPRWREIGEHLSVIGFEPDTRSVAAPGTRLIPAAVGDPGPATLHLTRKPQVSSLLAPNRDVVDRYADAARFDVVERSPIDVQRVDSLINERVDAIKVDTQGTELAILATFGALLATVWAIEVEVEMVEIYQGQPLFGEVDLFLRDEGFLLVDLRPYRWRRADVPFLAPAAGGEITFADALYLRDPATFDPVAPDDVVRGAGLAWVLGAPALAHHVITTHAGVLGADAEPMLAAITARHGARRPIDRLRRRAAKQLVQMATTLSR